MFGISGTELTFILVFALIIFGPDKLPQLGRTVGRFMNEFKRAQESVEATINAELNFDAKKTEPEKAAPAPSIAADEDEDEEDEE
jgi:sec-independent protein translocase protein TatB